MLRSSQRGSCLNSIGAIVIGLVIMAGGLMEGYEIFQNRNPVEMSLAEYVKAPPPGKYVKLSGCQVALLECVYEYEEGREDKVDTVYVPVHPEGGSLPTSVVIKTESYVSFIKNGLAAADMEKYLQKNEAKLTEVRSFEGWVKEPPALAKSNFGKEVKPGFIVIDVDHDKTWGVVAIMECMGFGLFIFGLIGFRNRD